MSKTKTVKNAPKVNDNEILSFPVKKAVINFGDQVLELSVDPEGLTGEFVLTIGENRYTLSGTFA